MMDYFMPRADIIRDFVHVLDQSVPCLNNPLGVKAWASWARSGDAGGGQRRRRRVGSCGSRRRREPDPDAADAGEGVGGVAVGWG